MNARRGQAVSGTTRRGLAAGMVACGLVLSGCRSNQTAASAPPSVAHATTLAPPRGSGLQPVVLPDFSKMEPPVRRQMEEETGRLTATIESRRATSEELASGYGRMGQLLMAATFLDAAEACYLNAQKLAPDDGRWPYYLGHLYKGKGPPDKSVSAFERALQIMPSDVPTQVWLGDAYLAQGRADDADRVFDKVVMLQPALAAGRFGAGRAALARHDYRRAIEQLSEALRLQPQASGIQYPLAMAYRGLGDMTSAEAHAAQRGNVDPKPADPLMEQIDQLLESPEAYNVRGGAELAAGHWAAAAADFRKGLELAPRDPSLRHRLGTALYQMGDASGALQQFEQVLQTSPDYARAHFSLALLQRDAGRNEEAVAHFSAALKSEPNYVSAHVELAGVLARTGQAVEALKQYAAALAIDPANAEATFGRGMVFVRLGRYADARDVFEQGAMRHADDARFNHALARVLAAAPDPRVRDGRRALALVDQLIKGQQTIELAETTAMALAESGRYKEAGTVQRDALAAATSGHLPAVEHRLSQNLALYEQNRPCRTPFSEDELSGR